MSGHSKWATIHRQKEANDAKRGQLFSKLAKAITVATKTGGGPDPANNIKLRMLIEKGRAVNMPKSNIERAISNAIAAKDLEEVTYEGFGPGGVAVVVWAATDNRNRTSAEVRNIFERHGGSFGQPGSVSFNFESKGYILVAKGEDVDQDMLELIDMGAEDVEAVEEGIEVYVSQSMLGAMVDKIKASGREVNESDMILKPKQIMQLPSPEVGSKAKALIEALGDHEDVSAVFTNFDPS